MPSSTSIVVNGVTYPFPDTGDEVWGDDEVAAIKTLAAQTEAAIFDNTSSGTRLATGTVLVVDSEAIVDDLVTNDADLVLSAAQGVVLKAADDAIRGRLDTLEASPINTQSGATYTIALADAAPNAFLELTNDTTATTVTVTKDATRNFPIGSVINGEQVGTAQVTFVPEDGAITISVRTGLTLKCTGQFSFWGLRKRAANTWELFGDLELA